MLPLLNQHTIEEKKGGRVARRSLGFEGQSSDFFSCKNDNCYRVVLIVKGHKKSLASCKPARLFVTILSANSS
jgi:hypothetical protein